MNRRCFLKTACGSLTIASVVNPVHAMARRPSRHPNFIVIFADDLGYNDLGCFGSPLIKTPNIDQMAKQGMRFTDFYVAAPVCTPSRAALMTGCYPQRISMASFPRPDKPSSVGHVLFPYSKVGLNKNEITIAELLKDRGYATACIGKWHLGHLPPFLPTRHGFDYYFGIPYSNDMKPTPLMRNEKVIEEPAVQETLTERYTDEALRFIETNRDQPFFLYFPHTFPHVPLHVSKRFAGRSERGLYGDVVECIDWSVGRVLERVKQLGLDRNTFVMFTSDNGPWYARGENSGNATPLRSAKGTTYDGGMRVPCVMRWPGMVPAGSECSELATTMDILPTLARLAGTEPPTDRIIDGKDILPLITGVPGAKSPYDAFFYYFGNDLHAVRSGKWKLKLETTLHDEDIYQRKFGDPRSTIPEALYNLETDPGEQKSVLKDHPDVVARLRRYVQRARQDLGDARLGKVGANIRPVGRLTSD